MATRPGSLSDTKRGWQLLVDTVVLVPGGSSVSYWEYTDQQKWPQCPGNGKY